MLNVKILDGVHDPDLVYTIYEKIWPAFPALEENDLDFSEFLKGDFKNEKL